tara:strand:- start:262 stop:477 length:216 start_codon:yes stop_codon:yes gene_type:complete
VKNIPIIFPIALVAIIVTTFFSGAYAIAEGAVRSNADNAEQKLAADSLSGDTSSGGHDWYQSAAILVCPLH